MRIALINNGTKEPEKLLALLRGHTITEFTLEDAASALCDEYDLIVLSGSSRFPIAYNLETLAPELRLIRECSTPLIGICFGAELLAVAYGGTLRDSGHKEKGVYEIDAFTDDPLFLGTKSFQAYEAHRWVIDTLPDELEMLASSAIGPEIIRHRTKPQYGFQFHPEKMCDETYGDELFRTLLDSFVKTSAKQVLTNILEVAGAVVTYKPLEGEVDALSILPISPHAQVYEIEPDGTQDPLEAAKGAVHTLGGSNVCVYLPGQRFDITGTRHGRGGGWYDRFISSVPPSWVRIGFCTVEQFSTEPLERNEWDEPVDFVFIVDSKDGTTACYKTGARPMRS